VRKSFVFAVAGAGLILTGCNLGNHRYQPIPVDSLEDEPAIRQRPVAPAVQVAPVTVQPQPAVTPIEPVEKPVRKHQYAPMKDVKSSGGVDSVNYSKKTRTNDLVPGKEGVHIIQKGDTPDRIARKYNVNLADLMKVNNLNEQSAKRLRIGQKLIIPARRTKASPSTSTTVEKGKYKVQKGDTLGGIAKKLKVKLNDLYKANNLNDESAKRLQIGQLLTIPGAPVEKNVTPGTITNQPAKAVVNAVDPVKNIDDYNQKIHVADKDTTYAEMARTFGITEAQLRHINGGITDARISQGEEIIVPIIK